MQEGASECKRSPRSSCGYSSCAARKVVSKVCVDETCNLSQENLIIAHKSIQPLKTKHKQDFCPCVSTPLSPPPLAPLPLFPLPPPAATHSCLAPEPCRRRCCCSHCVPPPQHACPLLYCPPPPPPSYDDGDDDVAAADDDDDAAAADDDDDCYDDDDHRSPPSFPRNLLQLTLV